MAKLHKESLNPTIIVVVAIIVIGALIGTYIFTHSSSTTTIPITTTTSPQNFHVINITAFNQIDILTNNNTIIYENTTIGAILNSSYTYNITASECNSRSYPLEITSISLQPPDFKLIVLQPSLPIKIAPNSCISASVELITPNKAYKGVLTQTVDWATT